MSTSYPTSPVVFEVAWEACNQVGGIYTVLRSKSDQMVSRWKSNYILIGPYFHEFASAEFDPLPVESAQPFVRDAIEKMRKNGIEVHYGHWLISGKPLIILINPYSLFTRLGEVKFSIWQNHGIESKNEDHLLDQVIAFNAGLMEFFEIIDGTLSEPVIAHFHEWMAGLTIPSIRQKLKMISTVFTTHATMLGRYLAMNSSDFYGHLPFIDWAKEAAYFNIETKVQIERAAAHGAHVLSTVSDVTAKECRYLLGREPDVIMPNGLNIQRFEAFHEFQNLHQKYKEKIHTFVMGHFFHNYSFDLDNTLYFFTSGRYEYKNKGFDLTLEALARLNWRLQRDKIDRTIVMFYITKRPFHSINPGIMQSRGVMEEVRETTDEIIRQIKDRLFYQITKNPEYNLPILNDLVDEYWKLRLRRTLQSWKSGNLPSVVTHNLTDDTTDELLGFIRSSNLINKPNDKVKVVYHPDFVSPSSPLLGMEYHQFIRGCHLGIFPSYYEPWGYTPLECIASGVPTVTSDLSGFGDYVLKTNRNPEDEGIYVVNRFNKTFHESAQQLADNLYEFVILNRRDRISLRNTVEESSVKFDWSNMVFNYVLAYNLSLERLLY